MTTPPAPWRRLFSAGKTAPPDREEWADRNASEIAQIYARSAALDLTARNPIVVIPGVMGSKLVDVESAQSVWGDFSRSYADPKQAANRRLIALPMERGTPLHRLASSVAADGSVSVARPRRLPFAVSTYRDILQTLGVGSGVPSARYRLEYGAASLEFGYDWRRSLDETARALDAFLRLATVFVQGVRKNSDPVKFDIVAHSMGGLVLRYYLRYGAQLLPQDGSLPRITWAGSERVARAICIGTPNAGSIVAIKRLVGGLPEKRLVHPGFDPFIVGTMPALYQLLPRTRHQPLLEASSGTYPDLFDPGFWEFMGWGLAGRDAGNVLALQLDGVGSAAERSAIAIDHLEKCLFTAKTFHASLDVPAQPPSSLSLHLLAGDAIDTPAVAAGTPNANEVSIVRHGAGDGVVLRSSAVLDERVGGTWQRQLVTPIPWSSITFAGAGHLALTRDRAVIDNVLFRLFEDPRH